MRGKSFGKVALILTLAVSAVLVFPAGSSAGTGWTPATGVAIATNATFKETLEMVSDGVGGGHSHLAGESEQ